jgi:uncharacterized membrane protein YphA (DoxX/SURF4 family)
MSTPTQSSTKQAESMLERFFRPIAPNLLRWALGLTILSAVADRFGLWGPPGTVNVSWGDWSHFVGYTAKVNSFAPGSCAPALAVVATVAEIALGIGLIVGIFPRMVALASAGLFLLFATAMTISFGIKAPLNFSVFADAGGALLLCAWPQKGTHI